MNPVALMTQQLQGSYSKAGDDMAKQMAVAVVAIVTGITSGQGLPGMSGWYRGKIPDPFKAIILVDKLTEAKWVIATKVNETPLLQGEQIWWTELTSGHRLLVLG